MGVTTLSIHSWIYVFLLLSTLPGQSCTFRSPGLPVIAPDKLQFFEYESVSVRCVGVKDMNVWRVIRKLYKTSPTNDSEACSIPGPSCIIDPTFEKHSGEYWCENDEGERSHALNISVTAGSVILQLAAQPVKEGSDVTLSCINKNRDHTQITDFFKDGLHLGTSYENTLTLQKVSKADEGLYKCSISEAGDSAESWLAVVNPGNGSLCYGSNEETQPVHYRTPVITILLCTLGSLLCLVIGMIFFKKRKALKNETVTDLSEVTYAVVNKPRKMNGEGAANGPDQDTYTSVQMRKKGWEVCAAHTGQYSSEQQLVYSLVSL
ncbi:hypothetical protein ATANTOWER_031106 [Ataeniobius toweri]|uniref:Ig-like domain-containing protein n=1 Tax=Ataeniobius toweri TaxID=208326 RepID=A0ABU7AVD3_9TELE|nr:hypothetical protein [Ataeniobius toweri]